MRAWLVAACGIIGFGACIGCGSSAGEPQNQGACAEPDAAIVARARASAAWPVPLAPGLEGALAVLDAIDDDGRGRPVAPDAPREILAGFVDPDPTTRGSHPGLALRVAADCAVTLAPIGALPLPAGATIDDVAVGSDEPIGDVDRDATRGALVVAGADFAQREELARWHAILDDLAVRGRSLRGVSPSAVEAAIIDGCGEITPGGVFVIAMTGRGSDGGLVLGQDDDGAIVTLPWVRALAAIESGCAHLAMVAWVVDASGFALAPTPSHAPPMVVVRGSDGGEAARATTHGPGLLGAVLDGRLARRGDLCARARLESAEIAALFADAATLRDELVAARWRTFGVPAVARLEAAGELTPTAIATLEEALQRAIPERPITLRGDLPEGERCRRDVDCEACALGTCERVVCSRGLCRVELRDGGGCDDRDPCTERDRCDGGACGGEAVVCDDGDPCTDEVCEPGRGCVAGAVPGRACDDGEGCTTDDRCDDRGACIGAVVVCDDGDPCTDDRCATPAPGEAATCVFVPVNGPCDDGDPCTVADQCRGQVCSGTARTCGDDNVCTRDTCDATSGECRFDPVAELVGCDDGDPCTTLDRCREGACRGLAATCDDGLACTFDRCDGGVCEHLPAPGSCLSPTGAGCVAVGERPAEAPCLVCAATDWLEPAPDGGPCPDDGIACTRDVCAAGVCVHRDTEDACHTPEGRCVTGGDAVTDCLVCRGAGVVTAAPAGAACTSSVCAAGACDGLGSCRCP